MKKMFKMNINKKNVLKISSGTLAGQLINILTLPIITSIYGSDIIGQWALIQSLAVVINSFSDLGLMNSLMIESEEELLKSYRVTSTIVVFISTMISFLYFLYDIFKNGLSISSLLFSIMLMVIIITEQRIQIDYTWLNRDAQYSVLMKNPIVNFGTFSVVAIVLGLLGFTTYGYFLGQIIGRVITLFHMRKKRPRKTFTFTIEDYVSCFKRNKHYIKYQMPNNIITNLKNQLPVFLIEHLWGTTILGQFSITVKVLQLPTNLLGTSVGRVFFQNISRMKMEGKNIKDYTYNNIIKGTLIGIIPMSLLMAYGDLITVLFLGQDWKMAGDFIRIMSIQYFFMFLLATVRGLAVTLNKQKISMISNIAQSIGFVLGAVIGYYVFNNIYIGLILMCITFIVIQLLYFSVMFTIMGASSKKYILRALISIFVIFVFAYLLRKLASVTGLITFIYSL